MPSERPIFKCRQCGQCCQGYGGTYVSDGDLAAIADYVGLPIQDFKKKYCRLSGRRYLLAQNKTGLCAFVKDRICDIHPVKPRMCREWPYIPAILVEVANWHKMATCCPGIRTNVSDQQIILAVTRELKKTRG